MMRGKETSAYQGNTLVSTRVTHTDGLAARLIHLAGGNLAPRLLGAHVAASSKMGRDAAVIEVV